jgi:hypothetical protein
MKLIITENQFKTILEQATKQKTVAPKNLTYSTQNDRVLTSDSTFGGDLKIPKGTRFTSHQSGFAGGKGIDSPKYWVSVDRMKGGKLTYSTIYWCSGENKGKFWNVPSKSWYIDEKKVLSGYLSNNLCNKAYGDQYRIKNADKWIEQADRKKEDEWALANSPYTDANGKKVMYYRSTDFKRNYDFLKSQGLVVDGVPNPQSPNQQFNLCALFSIKYLTDYQTNRLGWNNTECLQIGLSSLGNVKMVSKKLQSYGLSIKENIENPQSPLWTHVKTKVEPLYANFMLSDFYFKWGQLVNDINANPNNNNTFYFPDGVYNFMNAFYGSLNVNQIKGAYDRVRPSCIGGGLTAEQGHSVIEGLQIASMFIPFVGPFLAAGLGIADSAIYYSEGKKGEAGLTLALSIIPFAAEIPALKNVGKPIFKAIADKTIKKIPFNPEELKVVQTINAHKEEFKKVTETWIKKQSSNKTVQEMLTIAKNKGEEAIKGEIAKATGVNVKLVPTNKKELSKIVKGQAKDVVKGYATNVAKSIDAPPTANV